EFLVTTNKVHKTWATAELRKLLDLQEKDSDLPTITTLVASFRKLLRIIKPQGPTLSSFGASLSIADGIGSNNKANTTKEGSSLKPQANQNQPPGKCICLKDH
ncbi:hypothetical protein EK21DRAFT_70287, partial [Setomelanomma holmii]